jgi:hypothetical protein
MIGLKFLEATDISTAVTDSTYTNLIKLCFFQPVCVTERESGRQRERERVRVKVKERDRERERERVRVRDIGREKGRE